MLAVQLPNGSPYEKLIGEFNWLKDRPAGAFYAIADNAAVWKPALISGVIGFFLERSQ